MPETTLHDPLIPESYYGFIFHYYRAEVYRETNWRNRLDVTTNWSIIVTAAILSFVFTNAAVPHAVILINFLIVWFFLYTESRRFRYYTVLKQRTRILEKQLLAPIFAGSNTPFMEKGWKDELIKSFRDPHVVMSRLESVAWRLRRTYIFIFPLLFLAWLAKIQTLPQPAYTFSDMLQNAKLWFVPGIAVFVFFVSAIIFTSAIALYIPHASHADDLP